MTILSVDIQVSPRPSTYLDKYFKWHCYSCHIILKSMHRCRNYGSDKLIYVTFKCDLDLQLTCKNVSNDTSLPQRQQLCRIILKFIRKHKSYGSEKSRPMHGCMHASTYELMHAHTPNNCKWARQNGQPVYLKTVKWRKVA